MYQNSEFLTFRQYSNDNNYSKYYRSDIKLFLLSVLMKIDITLISLISQNNYKNQYLNFND